jgi:hypothetical protein
MFFNGSTAVVGPGRFFSLLFYLQWVGLLGRMISSSQGLYLNTQDNTKTQNKHICIPNIHALSWIRTHDHSVRASDDGSCLRPLGYRDRGTVAWGDKIRGILCQSSRSTDATPVKNFAVKIRICFYISKRNEYKY